MKAVIFALVLGILLNMSSAGGQVWPIGSVIAIVVMGVWIKLCMDRRFDALEALCRGGGEAPPDTSGAVEKE